MELRVQLFKFNLMCIVQSRLYSIQCVLSVYGLHRTVMHTCSMKIVCNMQCTVQMFCVMFNVVWSVLYSLHCTVYTFGIEMLKGLLW